MSFAAALLAAALLAPPPALPQSRPEGATILVDRCCKRCSKGKACGDSCIARDRTCSRPKGCACDR